MIRKLEVLVGAAMALAVVGVFGAGGAQGHTPATFHCHMQPCAYTLEADGTGATAHQVYVIKNNVGESLSLTCTELTGYATSSTKTTETLTFTNLVYHGCKANGQPMTVRMNGCHYDITAAGTKTIQCPAGKAIEREIVGTGCIITTGSQGPLAGVKFHNLGATGQIPATTDITIETKIPGIAATLDNAAGGKCFIDETKTPITSEFTTGNLTLTGYNDPAGTPDQHGNVRVDVWWSATVA